MSGRPRISGVVTAQKRHRCDGHLADHHFIEAGQQYVADALPPGDPDIGNDRWLHLRVCMDCCPLRFVPPSDLTVVTA